jgi:hypothetical protein
VGGVAEVTDGWWSSDVAEKADEIDIERVAAPRRAEAARRK